MFKTKKQKIGAFVATLAFIAFVWVGFESQKEAGGNDLSGRFIAGDVITVEGVWHVTDGAGNNTDIVFVVRNDAKRGLVSMDKSSAPELAEKLLNALRSKEKVTL